MLNVVYDLETNDPDDVFTLCLLAGHPEVELRGITILPGSAYQVGLVRKVLDSIYREDVPIAGRNPSHPKKCVSEFHYRWLGDIAPSNITTTPVELLKEIHSEFKDLVFITGAAKTNLYEYMSAENPVVEEWVAQGCFAGDNIVPENLILEKFKGRRTCATFNFGGNKKAALYLLSSGNIKKRFLVSKNVCHGMIYDKEMHERIKPYRNNNLGIKMIYHGMDEYLQKNHSRCSMIH